MCNATYTRKTAATQAMWFVPVVADNLDVISAGGATSNEPVRVGFVVHVMQVAGAEVLVKETIGRLGAAIQPVVLCLDAVGPLGEELKASGVSVVSLGRTPGLSWRPVRSMADRVREHNLDVLHAHQYTPFFYGALGARRAGIGTRVILTEHGRHYPDIVSTRRRLANRWLMNRLVHRVTAVCRFSAEALSRNDGFPADRIEVIENGIDLARYQAADDKALAKKNLGLDPGRRYVACVARFHPVKDHRMLIDAFGRLASTMPDVDLLLVGDGPLRPALQTQVEALGLTARVLFLGVRPDISNILAAVEAFALTSVSEAASITVLEAMASGLPIIATAVGGNPEMVRHGIDGELVPRGDAAAMAEAMSRILDDPALAKQMGRNAAERVEKRYQLDRTIQRYFQLYSELASARRNGMG